MFHICLHFNVIEINFLTLTVPIPPPVDSNKCLGSHFGMAPVRKSSSGLSNN